MCVLVGHKINTNPSAAMEDDGAVSSPQDPGTLDAEATPAIADGEDQVDDNDNRDNDNDNNGMAAADDDEEEEEEEEGASRRRRAREDLEGGEEEKKDGVPEDAPYEYPTGLIEADDQ